MEEKIITLNFRKNLRMVARQKRKRHFFGYLRRLLAKKSSAGKIKIDTGLNRQIWQTASGKSVGKFRIKIVKRDDGTVVAQKVD